MNGVELELILWAALPTECATAGPDIVNAIAIAIAYDCKTDIELYDAASKGAAVELIAGAAFITSVFAACAIFSLREGRPPSAHELVFEVAKNAPVARGAFSLVRAFLAQRVTT